MSTLFGFPNKMIVNVGTTLMLDPIVSKFMYYSDESEKDILKLEDLDNPIEELKDNKVFYSRRIDKILHESDISMYITLYDYRPFRKRFDNAQFINQTKLEIGVICHNECRDTLNGLRDIAVVTRIIQILSNNEEIRGIGKIKLEQVHYAYNMPVEYCGFQIIVSAEGFEETI